MIVGSITIAADDVTDSLTLAAGDNVTISADAANDKVIISAVDTTYNEAGTELGLVKSGGDVTISNGVITVNDDSHNHIISNIDNLQSTLDSKQDALTFDSTPTADSTNPVTSGGVKAYVDSATPTNIVTYDSLTAVEATPQVNADTLEGHASSYFVAKSGGTMTGALVAQTNTNYTTAQMRNVIISTADPSGGNNGDIWLKYEA